MIWYYVENNERVGPIEDNEFQALIADKRITGETLVWNEGMSDWKPFKEVESSLGVSEETVTCWISGEAVNKADAVVIGGQWVSNGCKEQAYQQIEKSVKQNQSSNTFSYGGFWIRFAARIIDMVIIMMVQFAAMFVIGLGLGLYQGNSFQSEGNPLIIIVTIISYVFSIFAPLFYEVWMVHKYGGTIGKRVLGLRVVRSGGEGLTLSRSIGRYFAYMLNSFTIFIGFIIAAFDEEKRTLHDHIADTRVVKD